MPITDPSASIVNYDLHVRQGEPWPWSQCNGVNTHPRETGTRDGLGRKAGELGYLGYTSDQSIGTILIIHRIPDHSDQF